MAYNPYGNSYGNNNNTNGGRDLLEDFLNDMGPAQPTGPSPSSITSLSSANMGGLNYNRNATSGAPGGGMSSSNMYPSSSASTNPFLPTPSPASPGYSGGSKPANADPFDDDAFNFRSTPYSPPNPATNPFYLKTSSPTPQPQQQPQVQPLQQAIHIPTSATNGSGAAPKQQQQQQQSNKYGSSYGSRPTQAPTSVSSASSAPPPSPQPNFFQSAPQQQQQQPPATFNVTQSQLGAGNNFNPYGPPPTQQQAYPPAQANPYGAPPLPQSAPPQRNAYVNTGFDDFPLPTPTPVQPLPSGVVPSAWTPNGVPPPQQQQPHFQQAPPPQQFQQPPMGMSGGYPPPQQPQMQQQPPPPMNNMQASNGFGQPPANSQPKAAQSKSGPMGSSFFDSVKGLFTPGPDPALLKKKVGRR